MRDNDAISDGGLFDGEAMGPPVQAEFSLESRVGTARMCNKQVRTHGA